MLRFTGTPCTAETIRRPNLQRSEVVGGGMVETFALGGDAPYEGQSGGEKRLSLSRVRMEDDMRAMRLCAWVRYDTSLIKPHTDTCHVAFQDTGSRCHLLQSPSVWPRPSRAHYTKLTLTWSSVLAIVALHLTRIHYHDYNPYPLHPSHPSSYHTT